MASLGHTLIHRRSQTCFYAHLQAAYLQLSLSVGGVSLGHAYTRIKICGFTDQLQSM